MKTSVIPETIKFEAAKGDELVTAKSAAKLAGIHPEILAMGRRLLKSPTEGGVFRLGTPDMVKNAVAIENAFAKGLRRVAKAFGTGQKAKTFLDYEQKRIVVWME